MKKYTLVLLIGLFFGSSCKQNQSTSITRPIQPWAIRSVLDYKPRMLTLALDSTLYVGYDLENCRFYKAWRGGVNWDGIVYNDTKVIQPTSWGTAYTEDPDVGAQWWLEENGSKIFPDVRFEGYSFKDGQIFLLYTLSTSKDTIQIEERPEYIETEEGAPGLERVFTKKGKYDLPVYLSTQSQVVELVKTKTIFQTIFDPLPEQVQEVPPIRTDDKGRYWLEKSDCPTCHEWSENNVGPSFSAIAEKYSATEEVVEYLTNRIRQGGSGVWGSAIMNPHPALDGNDLDLMVQFILSLDQEHDDNNKKTSAPIELNEELRLKPGYGAPLVGVHPSYELTTLDPPGYDFRVGGLAFFPDGRLLVTTWSPEGSVYILEGVESGDSSKVKVQLIAQGLREPLGAAVVNGAIYVLQKDELTQLIDHNGDNITDEYKSICNSFEVSTDFHEFAFGLLFKDNYFYANLSIPMRLMVNEVPLPDRGRTIKIALDGSFEHLNHGLRQPNGIGWGVDGEIFVTDNQGQWLPGNKLIHIQPGAFHGMRWGLPDSLMDIDEAAPTVWLPQDEIANSPSEPTIINDGVYQGQMLYGDVGHGGIKRVYLEKINDSYQGVVFRFTQGLKAGVNRLRWGPDGALYIGEVGMVGGWSWQGMRSGLQRLKFNGKPTFEMLAIRSRINGFEIEFTEPLAKGFGNSPDDYKVQQWWYLPTASYGGPKKDLEFLMINEVQISEDRKIVSLDISGLKPGRVVYFKLDDNLVSATAQNLWSSEAWYTLNSIAQNVL